MAELSDRFDYPDLLTFADGSSVASAEAWRRRREELKHLFQQEMYGFFPPAPEAVDAEIRFSDAGYLDGTATLREVTLTLGAAPATTMNLLLAVPNGRNGPVPAFVGMNFGGNHTLTDHPRVALPSGWVRDVEGCTHNNRALDAGRNTRAKRFPLAQIVEQGYAIGVFYMGDVDPDTPEIRGAIHRRHDDRAFGALVAWAWGLQRAADYLRDHPAIDGGRIATVGHSRNGKTALLAAAFDERIALAVPHQAGCGGTAPSRTTVGETVRQINDRFPHWFNDAFKRYNDCPEALPFDQHGLIALMAPRPVVLTNAGGDPWANPAGQFDMLRLASAAWRLLGAGDLGVQAMPELNQLVDSTPGYWIRSGNHSMGPEDWRVFLDFADRRL
ncbi:MAG: acetylxylan esterase [Planctomycetota bacterium]